MFDLSNKGGLITTKICHTGLLDMMKLDKYCKHPNYVYYKF